MNRCIANVTVAGLACLVSGAAQAQSFNGSDAEQIFRLESSATYQQGCWDPCDCPLWSPMGMRGTMTLGPTLIGDAFDFREISDVSWYVSDDNGNDVFKITGSGLYFVTNWPGQPPQHALSLDLQIDGGDVQQFWSELTPVTSNDGSFDIQVTLNGMVCFDIVLQVNAAAVPLNEIKHYRLSRAATYQQGCFDPCDCILYEPVPMSGTFTLVTLRELGTYTEYAVLDVAFKVEDAGYDPYGTEITGDGLYTLIAGFAGMIESLELDLHFDGNEAIHFQSGFINSGEEFPEIEIEVNMNGLECFDIVLGIDALPRPKRVQAANVSDAQPIGLPMNSGD